MWTQLMGWIRQCRDSFEGFTFNDWKLVLLKVKVATTANCKMLDAFERNGGVERKRSAGDRPVPPTPRKPWTYQMSRTIIVLI